MGEGGNTLINLKKGDANDFKNKAGWVIVKKPFEALLPLTNQLQSSR
jgi:hypothetical protein